MTTTRYGVLSAIMALILSLAAVAARAAEPESGPSTPFEAALLSTQARLDAFRGMSEFMVAQFQFEADQVGPRRGAEKRLEKLLKSCEKDIVRQYALASKDITGLTKDVRKAFRRGGGPRAGNDLNDLLRQRLTELDAARAAARARLYAIVAETLAEM